MQKPSIPKGTRDFSPAEMVRRNYIFDTIKRIFKIYGYLPVETPAMENLSTLLGKYGEEGDKLLFKILNSGDFKGKMSDQDLQDKTSNELASFFAEKGLRYDLTVPFARFVVQHRNEITFPFKRYQIQPVWRADRPQKGRYREFFQCDVDVIGSDSILNEFELVRIMDDIFRSLNIKTSIKFNNRKILSGIAEAIGESEKMMDITIAIDKLEKVGLDNVIGDLAERGIDNKAIEMLKPVLILEGDNQEKIGFLEAFLSASDIGMQGVQEINLLTQYLETDPPQSEIELDIKLARGLNYYTGAIFEVKSLDVEIGSICGGGRYDDLTGIFGLEGVSGVGVSFGADRIYDVMLQMNLFPEENEESTRIMFVNFGSREVTKILPIIRELRQKGISAELYPDEAKMKKQLAYANNRNIPFVGLIGEEEIKNGTITLKDMKNGTQDQYSKDRLIALLV